MRRIAAALLAGTLFGLGLAISGMVNPAKVQGFLDLAGAWDPTLAFVMAGALATTMIGYRIVLRRSEPLLGGSFAQPKDQPIDRPLLFGAALFGIGWGLVGFCPGPAIASLAFLDPGSFLFVAAMVAGMALHRWMERKAG
jgi:uncharacterized protein